MQFKLSDIDTPSSKHLLILYGKAEYRLQEKESSLCPDEDLDLAAGHHLV